MYRWRRKLPIAQRQRDRAARRPRVENLGIRQTRRSVVRGQDGRDHRIDRRHQYHYGCEVRETLTGFKFIAEAIRKEEGVLQYVVGGEESYGYLVGDEVRDKDAVQSCCLLAELAHELAWQESSGRLAELHKRHKAYKEGLVSLVKEGRNGKAEIDAMMHNFR